MLETVEPIDFPPNPPGIEAYLLAPTVTVPAVVGLDEASAVAAVTASSLTPQVLQIPAFEPIGMVVFQSFQPGGQVEKGSPMRIYVSNGLIPLASMPVVVGITLSEAYKILNVLYDTTGMRVAAYAVCVAVPDPAQVDIVLTQDPPAGTPLSFGHNVWVNVGAAACP
jgi:beta-lactam-binding protein with PASTA domain